MAESIANMNGTISTARTPIIRPCGIATCPLCTDGTNATGGESSHGFHHQPYRTMHSRVDRSWGGNRPIHDRRAWKRERVWKRVH